MDADFAPALSEAFPEREVDALHPTGPSWNEANRTTRVEFSDGDSAYLKVAVDGDGSRIARERAAIAHVAASGAVPVPEVLRSDPGAEVPHLATAPVRGEDLLDVLGDADGDGKAALARDIGRALASVHSHRFDTHGHITGSDGGLSLDSKPWTDVLVDTVAEARSLAPSIRFPEHFERVVRAVEAHRRLLDAAPAVLLHSDPATPNCFVADGEVGYLDWELAHVGDPVRDLNRTVAQTFATPREGADERYVEAFHDGYRDRAGGLPKGFEARLPVYEAVRFLGVSAHVENYAAFLDEPEAEFADWVDAELNRRLAHIT